MKFRMSALKIMLKASHPVRGAWIEIEAVNCSGSVIYNVAPRQGCVD